MAKHTTELSGDFLAGRKDLTRWLRHPGVRRAGRRLLARPALRRIYARIPWQRVVPFPVVVAVELTNHCNLRCPMCYRFHARTRPLGHMDFALFERIIAELAAAPACAVVLTGFGEPLLHPEFERCLAHASGKGLRELVIITNATLLSAEKTAAILDADLGALHVSVDGNSSDTYNRSRVGAEFEATMANIQHFLEERERRRLGRPAVVLRSVLERDNEHELDALKRRWEAMLRPTDEIQIQPVIHLPERRADARSKPAVERRARPTGPYPACPVLRRRLGIGWDGEYAFCCAADLRSDLHTGFYFPDLSIEKAWRHETIDAVRRLHALGRKDLVAACQGCELGSGFEVEAPS